MVPARKTYGEALHGLPERRRAQDQKRGWGRVTAGHYPRAAPNQGVQPTGNSVRSCLAPAIPSG